MKILIAFFALFLAVTSADAQTISVYHNQRAVTRHIVKQDLTVKAIYVKQIYVYGEGPKTLLIWKCGKQEMYHYSFPLTTQDILQLRKNLISSGLQSHFPIYFEE